MPDTPKPKPKPAPVVPLGTVAPMDDVALDALAAITPADLERARRAFRAGAASTGYGALLDATPADEA